MSLSSPIQPALWPAPPVGTPRPALWSARRTVVAIVAAVGIGSLTAIAVSYADAGSASTGPFRNGQFQGPAGGRFNGGPFGGRQFGGPLGNGQFGQQGGPQQGGPLQGQLGSVPSGLPATR
jgi:hypothetical protein